MSGGGLGTGGVGEAGADVTNAKGWADHRAQKLSEDENGQQARPGLTLYVHTD